MNPYKLVVADVDGTLITSDKKLTDATIQAIEFIKSNNIAFAIASGRPVISVKNLMKKYQIEGLVDYIITSNGVETLNLNNNHSTKSYPLSKEDVVEIVSLMKDFKLDYACYDGGIVYTNYLNEIVAEIALRNGLKPEVLEIEDLPISQVNKIVFSVFEDQYLSLRHFQQHFDHPRFSCFFTQPELFEFVDKRVSKARGIEMIVDDLKISMDEVIAFGDAQNDIEMLIEVGLGVAMDNAESAIKQLATATTKSNDEDGIAYYLLNQLDW